MLCIFRWKGVKGGKATTKRDVREHMEKDNGGSCNAVNETREETTDAHGQLGESWQSI